MALTEYQRNIVTLLASRRKQEGVSYIAGGSVLNYFLQATRKSRDIDIFHDTTESLQSSWFSDRQALEHAGFDVTIVREAVSFIEADIKQGSKTVTILWVRDSAYRFFPLQEDDTFGLTLHPFDLATNKVLAAVGRLEPRDWIDTLNCHKNLQKFGYLIWAACGKDPGVNPEMIFNESSRMHYAQEEIDMLDFENTPPSAAQLSRDWKEAISEAKQIVNLLPETTLGTCLLSKDTGSLYNKTSTEIEDDLSSGTIYFHKGTIGGVWPQVRGN
jgi:hypothetical protein